MSEIKYGIIKEIPTVLRTPPPNPTWKLFMITIISAVVFGGGRVGAVFAGGKARQLREAGAGD